VVSSCLAYADPPAAAADKPANVTAPTNTATTAAPDAQAASLKKLQRELLTQGYVPTKRHNELQYCKSDVPTGSLVPSAQHCVAATDAARMEDILRENAQQTRQQQCPGGQCQVDGMKGPVTK
jgi:hypothetical protein